MTKARLIGFVVFALLMVVVLVALGSWQLQRLEWKLVLIEGIEQQGHQPVVSISKAIELHRAGKDIDYRPATITGVLDKSKNLRIYTSVDSKVGWTIISPLITDDNIFVLVERGFQPENRAKQVGAVAAMAPTKVTLTGYLNTHKEQKGPFTPDNDLEKNIWHWWSLSTMTAQLSDEMTTPAAPFVFHLSPGAKNTKNRPAFEPIPQPAKPPGLTNNHLQYAITWFSLAIIVLVMAGYFFWANRKESKNHDQGRV